jgi:hypothetical protein
MDPYLEDPALSPDVHHELISEIRSMLNQQVRPRYYAQIEERVYISDDTDPGRKVIIPDLRVHRGTGKRAKNQQGVGALQVAEAVEVTHLLDSEIREGYVKVMDREKGSVVTIIEILSPANKVRGASGRRDYLRKRKDVLASSTHLVEIDLLRSGLGVFPRENVPEHDYLVHMSRAAEDRRAWVWPIYLEQKLPVIGIPLRQPDPDAKLDLQALMGTVYDRAGYDLMVDYGKQPAVPLKGEHKDWAAGVLRTKGIVK